MKIRTNENIEWHVTLNLYYFDLNNTKRPTKFRDVGFLSDEIQVMVDRKRKGLRTYPVKLDIYFQPWPCFNLAVNHAVNKSKRFQVLTKMGEFLTVKTRPKFHANQ